MDAWERKKTKLSLAFSDRRKPSRDINTQEETDMEKQIAIPQFFKHLFSVLLTHGKDVVEGKEIQL